MFGKKPLKILFVAAEAAPFANVGGLASVIHALPLALRRLGHDARVMIPRYGTINNDAYHLKVIYEGLTVPTGNKDTPELICNVKQYAPDPSKPNGAVLTYFLENQEYYEQRANVYGYNDDPVRWALLSRGVLEFIKVSDWRPDIIASSDWSTGFLPNYLHVDYAHEASLKHIKTAFLIHNLYHQGMFDHRFVPEDERDNGHGPLPNFFDPKLLKANGMRRGIMYADIVSTVSPTYAEEIMTPDYGEELDELLKKRRTHVYGILNGINYELWNPETDPLVPHHFSVSTLTERAKNKPLLQERFSLPQDPNTFTVAIVSRLLKQKGFDLLYSMFEMALKSMPLQLIVVGEGDSDFMGYFQDLAGRFSGQVAANLKFDGELPHLVYSGADAVLIPSRFEPSGLTQMEAMRYGCIPIARKTGGLADTVSDYNPETGEGTGFTFKEFDSTSFLIALTRAYATFGIKRVWEKIQRQAMKNDFSWEHSAKLYSTVFNRALRGPKPKII